MLGGFSRLTRFWLFINDEENILILGPFAFQTSCEELLSFLDHTNSTTVNESEIVLISFSVPLISRGLKDFDSTRRKLRAREDDERRQTEEKKIVNLSDFSSSSKKS